MIDPDDEVWACPQCTLINAHDQNKCTVCDHPAPPPVYGEVSAMFRFPKRAPDTIIRQYYLYHLESCIRETEALQDIYLPGDISKCIVDYLKHSFYVGQQLDVQDTIKKWCKAEVREMKEAEPNLMLLIHYIGWHDKWDEWLDSTSERIAPFETHTLGIETCAKRPPFANPLLDQPLQFPGLVANQAQAQAQAHGQGQEGEGEAEGDQEEGEGQEGQRPDLMVGEDEDLDGLTVLIQMVESLGFSQDQCLRAVVAVGRNPDAIVQYILDHPDD
eukprot:TRINITY_DN2837_c0_g3_i3.p1 TRINITY_DN2837_c0_g3~~TRINITY_DN2837_c0_g3_i3.p1  ORF type:complete len:273 (+),score=34.86 TRINITY_DN2837_c0_g3_i3:74-892(+)